MSAKILKLPLTKASAFDDAVQAMEDAARDMGFELPENLLTAFAQVTEPIFRLDERKAENTKCATRERLLRRAIPHMLKTRDMLFDSHATDKKLPADCPLDIRTEINQLDNWLHDVDRKVVQGDE